MVPRGWRVVLFAIGPAVAGVPPAVGSLVAWKRVTRCRAPLGVLPTAGGVAAIAGALSDEPAPLVPWRHSPKRRKR